MMPECDAFISKFDTPLGKNTGGGSLAGLTVSVKDSFDIAGTVTGAGCPEWRDMNAPAMQTSPVVQTLILAGAQVVGKTHMDELAYSLMGVNARYGTPINPAAPDRVPGGSSSGSAVSVAARSVDIGLGSDTGGSVRLPASFCGIYGWRPTHEALSGDYLVPLAPSYDTPAFFTRELELMNVVAKALISTNAVTEVTDLWLPSDLWSLADADVNAALRAALPEGPYRDDPLVPTGDLSDWLNVFRIHQGYEIWQTLGPWIVANKPDFGPGIRERFEWASTITLASFAAAAARRAEIRAYLSSTIPRSTILLFPTSPSVAPLRTTPQGDLESFRNAALTMLCVAGHGGLPQLSIPFTKVNRAPVGLSLVGAQGADATLMAVAQKFTPLAATKETS
jgi:amidase